MQEVGVGRGAGAGGGGLSRRKEQHMPSWQEQALRGNGKRQMGWARGEWSGVDEMRL